jgi:hypothetical protein
VTVGRLLSLLRVRQDMLWQLRDLAPAALVPAAWLAAGGAHAGFLGETGLFIAHVVMAVFIAFFAVTGWSQMADGALRAWRLVLVVGLAVTLAGVAGFLVAAFETPLLALSIVGWMLLPAAGLAYTGMELPEARLVYYGGTVLSVAGAALYAVTLTDVNGVVTAVSIALVGIGQTAGIVEASLRG